MLRCADASRRGPMAELKDMTVQALRDLARKALGRGHSRLRTKSELIEALQAAQKKVAGAAEKAARSGARRVRDALRGEPEPDPEGYIVARVAGEAAARGAPHPMTESAIDAEQQRVGGAGEDVEPPEPRDAQDEGFGELPWAYGDDVLMALP